jgi:membrane-associated PAP2 superfamily phosphatase
VQSSGISTLIIYFLYLIIHPKTSKMRFIYALQAGLVLVVSTSVNAWNRLDKDNAVRPHLSTAAYTTNTHPRPS